MGNIDENPFGTASNLLLNKRAPGVLLPMVRTANDLRNLYTEGKPLLLYPLLSLVQVLYDLNQGTYATACCDSAFKTLAELEGNGDITLPSLRRDRDLLQDLIINHSEFYLAAEPKQPFTALNMLSPVLDYMDPGSLRGGNVIYLLLKTAKTYLEIGKPFNKAVLPAEKAFTFSKDSVWEDEKSYVRQFCNALYSSTTPNTNDWKNLTDNYIERCAVLHAQRVKYVRDILEELKGTEALEFVMTYGLGNIPVRTVVMKNELVRHAFENKIAQP